MIKEFHESKNLWGDTTETNKYIDGEGNIGTASNGDIFDQKGIAVVSSTNYTFSWSNVVLGSDDNTPYIRICFYTSNGGTFISRILVTPSSYPNKYVTFTIPNNCTYVDIRIDSETSTRGQHFEKLMLNTGSTALPYEPFETENLFDYSNLETGAINPSDGTNMVNNTQRRTKNYISVSPNTSYILSNIDNDVRVHQYGSDNSYKGSAIYSNTFTTDIDTYKIRIAGTSSNFKENTMLNVGSTPLPYTPYGSTWNTKSYAKSISGSQTYTKFPIVLRTTEQSIPTWSVKGNMQQPATPTPSSPITPSECGERTENWFNKNATNTANGYVSNVWLRSDGTENSESGFNISEYISCNASTQYTLKYREEEYTFNSPSLCFYDASYNFIDGINYGQVNPITITTPSNAAYMRISYRTVDASDVMLNTGSTAKSYEPYGYKIPIVSGGVTTNIYLSEPLRKIGDYADTIAADGTVTRVIKKLVLTGGQDESWTNRYGESLFLARDLLSSHPFVPQYTALSTEYVYNSIQSGLNAGLSNGEFALQYASGDDTYNVAFKNTSYTDVSAWQNYLQQKYADGTPLTFWYVLATPTTETTTTSTISTTSGLNTIDVNTTLKPSEMSLTYDGYKLCKRQRYDRTEQLFDLTAKDASRGYIVECYLYSDGTIATDKSGYQISEYIPIESETSYALNYAASLNLPSICFYDSSYNYISGIQYARVIPIIFQTPSNAAYCRFSMERVLERAVMFNKGSTSLSYQPYLDWK